MIRAFLAALGLVALLAAPAAPAAAQAGRDWSQVAERTPEGGFRIGNPQAPVKVVEYLSLTCSHCADFSSASSASLWANYVRGGRVSVEYRNFVLNGFDMAAALISRCAMPRRYFDMTHDLLAHQSEWMARTQNLTPAQRTELGSLPPLEAMQRLVPLLGLDQVAARHGITAAQARACLADQANLDRISALRQTGGAQGVDGTPTFFINGQVQQVNTWEGIEPLLGGR